MAYLGSTPARAPLSSAQIEDGTIDTADLATNAVTTAKITAANVTTAKIADANVTTAKLAAGSALIGKNLIENGAMNVSQRGSQTGQGGTSNVYTAIDRWLFRAEGVGEARVSTSQSSLSVANNLLTQGCRNAIEIDCTTAESSVAAGECLMLAQKVEARNLQHLLFGTSGAKDLTLSFAMRSPKSGTHCVSILQGDANRSYIAEFTIASADTLEHFSMTIPGDTGGTINNDTGSGMRLHFPLTAGTNFHNTAGSWFSGEDYATSNQQNLLDNTANNIYITAVQLEVGGVFTGFEFEPISVTLAKCFRYYYQATEAADGHFGPGFGESTTQLSCSISLPTEMRANPTLTTSGTASDYRAQTGSSGNIACSAVPAINNAGSKNVGVRFTTAGSLAVDEAGQGKSAASGAFLGFSADL